MSDKILTKINEDVFKNILDQEDAFLYEKLNAKPGDIKTREDLARYSFKCPWCNKVKPATELVVIKVPLKTTMKDLGERVLMEVHQRIGVCCDGCSIKIKIRGEG